MAKTVTLRLDEETYRAFIDRAKAQNRSLANFIETAVNAHIRESDFVDESEMASIVANERLVARLKKGSADAQKRKGSMIG